MVTRPLFLPRYQTPAASGLGYVGDYRADHYDCLSERKHAPAGNAASVTFLRICGKIKHTLPIWRSDLGPGASFIDKDLHSSRIGLGSRPLVNVATESRTGFVLAARIGF